MIDIYQGFGTDDSFSYRLPKSADVYFDDTAGMLVFGGTELATSFKGYIGKAELYRNKVVPASKVSMRAEGKGMGGKGKGWERKGREGRKGKGSKEKEREGKEGEGKGREDRKNTLALRCNAAVNIIYRCGSDHRVSRIC